MAHTFQNLSFETQGTNPGEAEAWSKSLLSSVIEIANFGLVASSPYEGWEEGWGTEDFVFEFAQLLIAQAVFPSGDPAPFQAEGFEWGWSNESWTGALSVIDDGEFTGAITHDGFEFGWLNDAWVAEIAADSDGLFDGGFAYESYDYEFVSNGNPLWKGLEEIYDTTVAPGVGSSPSNWPLGVQFNNSPDEIVLPAGVYDFEDIYIEVGDTIWIRNSDIGDSNGTRVVTSVSGNTIGVDFPWDNTGTATTRVFLATINNAAFVNHGGGGTPNFAPEHEFFDASAWEEMDTL